MEKKEKKSVKIVPIILAVVIIAGIIFGIKEYIY